MSQKAVLFAFLLAGAVLRLSFLGTGDALTDEVLYAFRAVGMLDFSEAALQTTPLEWFDPDIPWWTNLSFHDHPPLVFMAQNFFIKIFGENVFAFRLPSALFGMASLLVVFGIASKLFGESVGIAALAIASVTVNSVYISRLGLQESYVIFFSLLSVYFFIRAIEDRRFFVLLGISLGLAFLT